MKAIVLAAGKGTRLNSQAHNIPKVLREANNKPLLSYVLDNINFLSPKDIVIVVGYQAEKVIEATQNAYTYATQTEQLGTGHAVACAWDALSDYDGDILVLYGDMPLFKKETYQKLIEVHKNTDADCTILTSIVEKILPYGRIIRDSEGNISDIVEENDCTTEQKKINELNVGIYVFKSKILFESLKELKNDNRQGEYYLTSVPKILIENKGKVKCYAINSDVEIVGVNTLEDLQFVEGVLK